MKFEIKSRYDSSSVLFTAELSADFEKKSFSLQIGAAVKAAYLGGADLGGAYLRGADLRGADLGGADLGGADLGGADLRGADLGGADLGGADLRGADLGGAYLRGADLRGADLGGADLRGADLGGADLGGAILKDDVKINSVLQIGPIGSRKDCLVVFYCDKGVWVRAGCFFDTLAKFKEAVAETHGASAHGKRYLAAINLVEVMESEGE